LTSLSIKKVIQFSTINLTAANLVGKIAEKAVCRSVFFPIIYTLLWTEYNYVMLWNYLE